MSLTSESMGPADIAAVCGNNNGYGNGNNGGLFGNDWAWIVILLLFGWGGRGFGNGFGGNGNGGGYGYGWNAPIVVDAGKNCCCEPCATASDVRGVRNG